VIRIRSNRKNGSERKREEREDVETEKATLMKERKKKAFVRLRKKKKICTGSDESSVISPTPISRSTARTTGIENTPNCLSIVKKKIRITIVATILRGVEISLQVR
jgi:hypothetical protein